MVSFNRDKSEIIPVDLWDTEKYPIDEEDRIFKNIKGDIILPIAEFFHKEDSAKTLDYFAVTPKRSYNSDTTRNHICRYLNYFEKYYDTDLELAMIYCRLKYLIDYEPKYTKDAFIYDLHRYIMTGPVSIKLGYLNRDNYQLNLTYKNVKNPNLQYSDC